MTLAWGIIRFVFGAALGSFLNVVALRYDPERFLFSPKVIGGRSLCPHCKKTLRWFELVPLFSFLIQAGRCRHCGKPISFRYPLVELVSGLLFVGIPFAIDAYTFSPRPYALVAIWLGVFATLLLLSLIDLRLSLIPDEIHAMLALLAALHIASFAGSRSLSAGTFFPDHALLFGLQGNLWVNHLFGAFIAGLFFIGLVLVTRGRGMGMGDVKLAAALGVLFGWPDIAFLVVFGFLAGSAFGIWKILGNKKTLKSAVPFGPFLALGALIVVVWGNDILRWYFGLFGW